MRYTLPKGLRKAAGVYQILNTVNSKCYIGSTLGLRHRYIKHRCYLRLGQHPNKYLQNAFNKYGEICFSFELIMPVCRLSEESEEAFLERLQEIENSIILHRKTNEKRHGYNQRVTASSNRGVEHHEDALTRVKGKKLPKATRYKMSESRQGSKHHMAKFNEEQVRIIRILIAKGYRNINIAQCFNVPKSRINDIKNNGKWLHVVVTDEEVAAFDDSDYQLPNPSRLNSETVTEIKRLIQEGLTSKEIGAKLSVKARAVTDIRAGKTYRTP